MWKWIHMRFSYMDKAQIEYKDKMTPRDERNRNFISLSHICGQTILKVKSRKKMNFHIHKISYLSHMHAKTLNELPYIYILNN